MMKMEKIIKNIKKKSNSIMDKISSKVKPCIDVDEQEELIKDIMRDLSKSNNDEALKRMEEYRSNLRRGFLKPTMLGLIAIIVGATAILDSKLDESEEEKEENLSEFMGKL